MLAAPRPGFRVDFGSQPGSKTAAWRLGVKSSFRPSRHRLPALASSATIVCCKAKGSICALRKASRSTSRPPRALRMPASTLRTKMVLMGVLKSFSFRSMDLDARTAMRGNAAEAGRAVRRRRSLGGPPFHRVPLPNPFLRQALAEARSVSFRSPLGHEPQDRFVEEQLGQFSRA